MNICVIGDKDMTLGFRLAGVTAEYPVEKMDDTKRVLEEALQKEFDLIIISENHASYASAEIQKLRSKPHPVVIEVPDKSGSTGHAKQNIKDLIRRAVGIDITSKEGEAK
jgi:V/A-type H+-transporting ATPase subunit F|tara:strand:- start:1588 stop:1917 length:330 start_codon:yes stop_codon:yes gene_type:complete